MFKGLDLWLPAYLRRERLPPAAGRHLLLCVCDHFEPFHGAARAEALERVRRWRREYPQCTVQYRDSGGAPPRQTFFCPVEQYDGEVVGEIAALCRESRCEVEIHLHHEEDTAAHLAETLERGKRELAGHGLLAEEGGAIRFGFVHGNWALDNSHPEGRCCGVRNELQVLRDAGCYGDFTMPSAPDRTQTRTINSIYYADPAERPKSHDRGRPARVGGRDGGFLLVQGPLGLNWRRRKWGLLPRSENGDLTPANPPTADRLRLWLELNVHVRGRPEWVFAKLHTHGGTPRNMSMLLGPGMANFHAALAEGAARLGFRYHYVTARELVNIVHAAEAGCAGDPSLYRDFRYRSRIEREGSGI